MTREELIAALEKATGPDRALDFWCWWWGKATHDGQPPDAEYADDNIKRTDAPRYTASIDAALTLVPDVFCYEVRKGYAAQATVWRIDCEYDEGSGRVLPFGEHRYPAIALCIASLKARGDGA